MNSAKGQNNRIMKIRSLIKLLPATLAVICLTPPHITQAQPTDSPVPENSTPSAPTESAYDFYMRLGFAAAQRGDHQTAAAYFRSALYEIPNDQEATIAYWNARNAMQEAAGNGSKTESNYERYMGIGYDAVDQEDYQTALINFRRAADERPGDYYATQAIRNVQTYINRGEGASTATDVESNPNIYPGELPYDRYMRLGYAATQREDHQAAAMYFRSALYERPKDRQATIAYWNARDAIKEGKTGSSSQTETEYDRYMRIGYDATERGDYQTALINFRRALDERPGDEYATQAVRNVQTFINRGEGL